MSARSIAGCCAAAALLTTLAAALAASTAGTGRVRITALVHVGTDQPLLAAAARGNDASFVIDRHPHYDGAYYYAIALDPLARGDMPSRIDAPAYRYEHPGFGWLASLASFGQAAWVPAAMLALAVALAGLAGLAAALLLDALGLSPWWGLTVAVNPGLIAAATFLTGESLGLALVLGALLLWRRGRWGWAAAACAAACLVKEPLLALPLGIAAYELGARRRPLRTVLPLAAGPLLFAAWYGYLWNRLGVSPSSAGRTVTQFPSAPFAGWFDSVERAATLTTRADYKFQLGSAAIPLLVATGGALLIGAVRAIRLRTEVQAVFVLAALGAACLSAPELVFPKDLVRVLTVPLALLPFLWGRSTASRG